RGRPLTLASSLRGEGFLTGFDSGEESRDLLDGRAGSEAAPGEIAETGGGTTYGGADLRRRIGEKRVDEDGGDAQRFGQRVEHGVETRPLARILGERSGGRPIDVAVDHAEELPDRGEGGLEGEGLHRLLHRPPRLIPRGPH